MSDNKIRKSKSVIDRGEDYKVYHFKVGEVIGYGFLGICLYLMADYLLYRSMWLLLFLPVFMVLYFLWLNRELVKRRKQQLLERFLPAVSAFVVALKAGYAAENALVECIDDIRHMAGEDDVLVKEFRHMQTQTALSVPLEELFDDLGERSGLEDIRNFAQVFAIGKRTGGNMGEILSNVADRLCQKLEVQKDIQMHITSRRMEQTIMSLVPWGIVFYLNITSPDYMKVLYETFAGRVVVTICVTLYVISWLWGRKITEIEV